MWVLQDQGYDREVHQGWTASPSHKNLISVLWPHGHFQGFFL